MLKKAFMLVSGNAFASALLLIRNLLVARIVSPEDYGIASTFAISMSIVEMASYLGLQQLIVVDKDGDDPHVQKAMQGFQMLRGLLSFVLLLLIAQPYANFLGIPEVAWAYQVLAVIPLMNGVQHFDVHRMKRHMNFTPAIVTSAIPALVAVLSLWPIHLMFDDYRVMLASLVLQAAVTVALSHVMAERPYRVTHDMAIIRRSMVFGWPLLANGVMLFLVFNGEKLVVGRELGMAELAIFSMGFTLTLTPTLVMGSSIQTFFLPQLGAVQDRQEDFQRIGEVTLEAGLVIGVLLVLGVLLVGGPVIDLLLGAKYHSMMGIMVPLAILQAVRSAKTGSSVVALARKRSGNSIASNLFRVASLPVSWIIAVQTGDIIAIIWVGVAAEVLGYALSLYLVRTRVGLNLRPLMPTFALVSLTYVVSAVIALTYAPTPDLGTHLHVLQLIPLALGMAALWSMRGLRTYLIRRFRARRG